MREVRHKAGVNGRREINVAKLKYMSAKLLRSSQTIIPILLTIFVLACLAIAQKPKSEGPKFDSADFSKKFETVQWLVEYDEVAWKTSDVVMAEDKAELAKLGTEWFCLQDSKKQWHAFYGKLTDGKFHAVFHYTFGPASKVTRSTEVFDSKILDKYAIALATAKTKLKTSIPDGSPRFNQYIRKEANGTFAVWMLPAFQPNGMAVFGGEAFYHIDAAGSKILKEESYFQPGFRGFMAKPPREIWLDYREIDKPTLGGIFFVWYYKPYFTKIFLDTATSTSSLIQTEKNGYMWVNVEKEEPSKPKK